LTFKFEQQLRAIDLRDSPARNDKIKLEPHEVSTFHLLVWV